MNNFNQAEVLNYLVKDVIPNINENCGPKDTIIKFASEKNLPASVVEKMGHLFNAAKTTNYFNKTASNRGATFNIVDVPSLVEEYTNNFKPNKQASKKSNFEWVEELPNDQLLESPLFDSQLDQIKVANTEETEGLKAKRKIEKRAHLAKEIENLKQAIYEFESENYKLAKEFSKEYKKLYPSAPDFQQLESDVKYIKEASCDEAIEYVVKALGNNYVKVKRASDGGSKRIVDETDWHKKIYEIQENLDCIKIAAQTQKKNQSSFEQDIFVGAIPVTQSTESSQPSKSPKSENKPSQSSSKGNFNNNEEPLANKVREKITKSIIFPLAESLKGHSPKQDDLDDISNRTRAEAAFNTLLITDPVISDIDKVNEEYLREVFERIYQRAPSIAGSTVELRPVLRGAIQYQGIDPDTTQMLQKTEETQMRIDRSERDHRVYNKNLENERVRKIKKDTDEKLLNKKEKNENKY